MYEPQLVKAIQAMVSTEEGFIDERTFKNAPCLSYVQLPAYIRAIGPAAFEGCTRLTQANLRWIRQIYAYAFRGSAITSLTLNHIEVIAEYAFSYCKGLTSVHITTKGTVVINKHAFRECSSLKTFSGSKDTTFAILEGAFMNCTSLESFEGAVSTVGEEAFYKCNLGETIPTLKDSVLGRYAFSYAHMSYVHIDVPCTIKHGAFTFCKALSTVILGDWHKKPSIIVHRSTFFYCLALARVIIHKGVSCTGMPFCGVPLVTFVYPLGWTITKEYRCIKDYVHLYNYNIVQSIEE